MKKGWFINLIVVLVLIALFYLLYRVTGGDLTAWTKAGSQNGSSGGFLNGLTDGLQSVSDGIGNVFGRLRP